MFKKERRTRLRFNMSLPISVCDKSGRLLIHGMTRNISSSGTSFLGTIELSIGASVTFCLELPYEITPRAPVRLKCTGHVVGVEPQRDGYGILVGLHCDTIEFIRSKGTSKNSPATTRCNKV
jgi:PilZ domain